MKTRDNSTKTNRAKLPDARPNDSGTDSVSAEWEARYERHETKQDRAPRRRTGQTIINRGKGNYE